MDKQMSMSFFTDELSEVKTHKKEFLEQMNRLIPWGEWVELVKPCYYKGERGNKPYDLEAGANIKKIQMQLGHRTIEVTSKRYLHATKAIENVRFAAWQSG